MRRTFLEFVKERSKKRLIKEEKIYKPEQVILLESLQQLLSPISDIPYAIVGGHAVAIHGYPRTTQDIDVLTTPENVEKITQRLNFVETKPITLGGVSGRLANGSEIDILSPGKSWVGQAIKNAVSTPQGKVISPPFLVLMKLWASRGVQDDADMLHVLKKMTYEQLELTQQLIQKYLPNEVEDLEQLIMMKDYA